MVRYRPPKPCDEGSNPSVLAKKGKKMKKYFDDVKLGDEVYSIIYGNGKVSFVLEKNQRTPGFFCFQVQFKSDKVYYNEEGIPEWCDELCSQTLYYKNDLNKPELDYETIEKALLSKKKIVALHSKGKLEMRVPSGAWVNVKNCPPKVFVKALNDKEFYLFRKEQI